MLALSRITTEYIDIEDRISLTGEAAGGLSAQIWLTRRLLDRLVPHLTRWLEKQHATMPRADIVMSFAQQQAQSQLAPQNRVQPSAESHTWLAHEVDLRPDSNQVQVIFRGRDKKAAGIGFDQTALRQWLGILHNAYILAQWSQDVWPEWMEISQVIDGSSSEIWH
jgi:hypothetical protein